MPNLEPASSRPYSGRCDRRAMQHPAGRTWTPGWHWHAGDLAWQREKFPDGPCSLIRLWAEPGGPLLAWGRAGPDAQLDLVVDPGRADLADRVLAWLALAAAGGNTAAGAAGGNTGAGAAGGNTGAAAGGAAGAAATVIVSDHDSHLIAALTRHGYRPAEDGPFFVLQARALTDLPAPVLPEGYRARVAGPADLAARASSHRAAWESTQMTDDRYLAVTGTWPYRPDLDWVIEAPDASFAANCLLWLDEQSGSVLMEPVGTDPAHRRRGLARAACLAALHAARRAGARLAAVNPRGDAGYPVPARLYRSIGFRDTARTVRYRLP